MRTFHDPKNTDEKSVSRRTFVQGFFYALLSLPALGMIFRSGSAFGAEKKSAKKETAVALPAGQTEVPATDAVAGAIGYVSDGEKYDKTKYKNKVAKSNCANCALYTKVNDGWGKCQMLQSGLVASKGWCGSWSKKA
jgi:hypothetical protein